MSMSVNFEDASLVMTEEEEQEIYRIHQQHPTPTRDFPAPRLSLLQRIASIRTIGSTTSSLCDDNNNNDDSNSVKTPINSKLEQAYNELEEEYCRLKFEQTELIALADQRKLQKMKSAKLMQSLDEEKSELTTKITKSRQRRISLQEMMKSMPKAFESKQEQRTLKSLLNSLLLKKDLEALKLSESKESIKSQRKQLEEKLLPNLERRPEACNYSVLHELERRDRQDYVDDLVETVNDLNFELEELRLIHLSQAQRTEGKLSVNNKKSDLNASMEDLMIGKDIVLDGDSRTEETTVTSSFTSLSQINVRFKNDAEEEE